MPDNQTKGTFSKVLDFVGDHFLVLVAAAVIAPLVAIRSYIHPVADDYVFANYMHDLGFREFFIKMYTELGGRFFSFGMLSVVPMPFDRNMVPLTADDLMMYRITPVLFMAGMALSLHHLAGSLFQRVTQGQRWVFSLAILTAYLSFNHPETLFWYVGAAVYTPSMMLLVLLASNLIRLAERPGRGIFLFTALTGGMTIGCNETGLVVANVLVFSVTAYMFLRSQPARMSFLSLFLVLTVFTLAAFLAPGNGFRDARGQFEHEKELIFALGKSISRFSVNSVYWVPVTALTSMLTLDYARRKGLVLKPMLATIHPFLTVAVLLACCVLSYFPNAWARGVINPAYRIVDVIQFIFTTGFVCCFLHCFLRDGYQGGDGILFGRTFRYMLMGIFLCTLYANTKAKSHVTDLVRKAAAYDREMMARYRQLASAPPTDTVVFPALRHIPVTIYFDDIRTDADNWRNRNVADYFHRKAVRLSEPNQYLEALSGLESLEKQAEK